jgi:hypothetical protein
MDRSAGKYCSGCVRRTASGLSRQELLELIGYGLAYEAKSTMPAGLRTIRNDSRRSTKIVGLEQGSYDFIS